MLENNANQDVNLFLNAIIPRELLNVLNSEGRKILKTIFSTNEQIQSFGYYKKMVQVNCMYRYSALFIGFAQFLNQKLHLLDSATKASTATSFCINVLMVVDPKNLNQDDLYISVRILSKFLTYMIDAYEPNSQNSKIILELFTKHFAHLQLETIEDSKKQNTYNCCLNFIIHNGLTLDVFLIQILPILYEKKDGTLIELEGGHFKHLPESSQIKIRETVREINTKRVCQKNMVELFSDKTLEKLNTKSRDFLTKCFSATDSIPVIEKLLLAKKTGDQTCYSRLLLAFITEAIGKTDMEIRSIVNADFCLYLLHEINVGALTQKAQVLLLSTYSEAIIYVSTQGESYGPIAMIPLKTKVLLDKFNDAMSVLMKQKILDGYKMEICVNYFAFIFEAYLHYIKGARESKQKINIQRGEGTFEEFFNLFSQRLPLVYKPEFFKEIEFVYTTIGEEYSRRIRPIIFGEKAADAERQRLIKELLAEEEQEKEEEKNKQQKRYKQANTGSSRKIKQKKHVKKTVVGKTSSNAVSCTKMESDIKTKEQKATCVTVCETGEDAKSWTKVANKSKKLKPQTARPHSFFLVRTQISPCISPATQTPLSFDVKLYKSPCNTTLAPSAKKLVPSMSKLTWVQVVKACTENEPMIADNGERPAAAIPPADEPVITSSSPSLAPLSPSSPSSSSSSPSLAPLSPSSPSSSSSSPSLASLSPSSPSSPSSSSYVSPSLASLSPLSLPPSPDLTLDLTKGLPSKEKCFAALNFLQISQLTPCEAYTIFKRTINSCVENKWSKEGLELFANNLYKIAQEYMSMESIQYFENIKHEFFREVHSERTYPRMGIHPNSRCDIYVDGFFKNCFTPEKCLYRLQHSGIYEVFNINPNISFARGLARDPILAQWASYRISEAIAIGEPVKDIIISVAAIIQAVDSGTKGDEPLSVLLRNQVRVDEKKIILDLNRVGNILGYIEEYTAEVNRAKHNNTQQLVVSPSLLFG